MSEKDNAQAGQIGMDALCQGILPNQPTHNLHTDDASANHVANSTSKNGYDVVNILNGSSKGSDGQL